MNQTHNHDPAPNNGTSKGNGSAHAVTHTAGQRVPHPNVATLADQTSRGDEPVQNRWPLIQAHFVDDPQKSVSDAHQLVEELMEQVVDSFAAQRDSLELQWSKGQISTEQLRVCLQDYRALFGRLLRFSSAPGAGS
jgi:hypothetical protein